jgi:hypothetical protein
MTASEALQSARFVIDKSGRRTAVLLDIQDWDIVVSVLEDVLDAQTVGAALIELQAMGGRPEAAGWIGWSEARDAWLEDDQPDG